MEQFKHTKFQKIHTIFENVDLWCIPLVFAPVLDELVGGLPWSGLGCISWEHMVFVLCVCSPLHHSAWWKSSAV